MGKKDKVSPWSMARMTIADQMLDQIAIGKSMDNGVLTLHEACKKITKKGFITYCLFLDDMLFLDKNHTVASLGASGHDGSFLR
jgi:hypothetical protein